MRTTTLVLVMLMLFGLVAAAAQPPASTNQGPATTPDQVIDRFLSREHDLVAAMRSYHPVVETYYQTVKPDPELGMVPAADHYFLGRLDMSGAVGERFYTDLFGGFSRRMTQKITHPVSQYFEMSLSPVGFSNMVMIDRGGFDRQHYLFHFLRREFLGEVRCMVFQVDPVPNSGHGRFQGRIWVEDRDYNIVRFNGIYTQPEHHQYYFHLDSWRANVRPGIWVPVHVYSEESDMTVNTFHTLRFKAQTRLWGYDLKSAGRQEEFTQMVIDNGNDVTPAAADMTPVTSERAWQREAEDNIVERLEKAGLLAPVGGLDSVLNTVVNNLEVTNNLDISPEVRCRVLMTAPLESFTVGHTIVVSRGLIDVLPDEASLAMVLAQELGHVLQGDQVDTKFAFSDRIQFRDEQVLKMMHFSRDNASENAAGERALALLKNSPYKDKLQTAGLFLRQLQQRASQVPNLVKAQLGNSLISGNTVHMAELMNSAPELQPRHADQIAALPLGARVRIDAWDDRVELVKAPAVSLLSPKEKMPFEVTPMFERLVRVGSGDDKPSANGGN